MEVIEGNKLIAEFMGFEVHTRKDNRVVAVKSDNQYLLSDYTDRDIAIGWHPVKFHTSWDWLVPSWSKLFVLFHKIGRKNEREWNEAFSHVDNFNIHLNHNNVSGAFETMIEALEWYNSLNGEQNKKL